MTARIRLLIAAALAVCLLSTQAVQAQQRGPQEERFQALLGLARIKRDAGDRADARRYFEDARRLRPFDQAVLAEYFWVLAGQDAIASLAVGREVLAGAPVTPGVRDRMITEAITTSDETTVIELATEGRRLDPGTARWPRRLAESYLRQGRAEQAAAAFALATNAPDATAQDRLGLAVALEAAKRYAESAAAWEHVPTSALAEHEAWARSRLRALAHGAEPSAAADELDAWLLAHPGDEAVRDLLVDLWVRAGRPDRALAALPPPDQSSDRWIRRRMAIARAAGLPTVGVEAIETLVASGSATADDRRTLAELFLESRAYEQAASALRTIASTTTGCDDRLLTLIDRVPDALGTGLLIDTLAGARCDDAPQWLRRGIERSVALERHRDALALLARLPAAERHQPSTRRLAGQLRLWTGDVRGAIAILEAVLQAAPEDGAARDALVDAYRASDQPYAAWRAAEPLLAAAALSRDRVLALAELALEADRPAQVRPLLDRLGPATTDVVVRSSLLGRSLLAEGRPAEARDVLSAVETRDLAAPGALALVDSVLAMSGAEAALDVARRFPAESAEWRDVLIRRVMLEAIAGDTGLSVSLRQGLRRLDEDAAMFADAETALAAQRPSEALALLAQLPDDPQPERAADLEAVALAGVGRLSDALAVVARLRRSRPESRPLLVREAELRFQLSPTDESLARLVDLSSHLRDDQSAATAAARSFAILRRHDEALAVLGPDSAWPLLPLESRLVAARSLQATGRPRDALALLGDAPTSNTAATELRAELIAVIEGPTRAAEAFAAAAARATATPQLFLKWAEVTTSSSERAAILTTAATRFPTHAGVLVQLAEARWAARDGTGATAAASQALDADPLAAGAWFVLLDAAGASDTPHEVEGVLRRFEDAASSQPALVIGMAERLAALVKSNDDPLAATALAWLDTLPPIDRATALSADLARARVLAAAERWPESIGAVDAALVRDATSAAALKLRAELLSWSGHHAQAIAAYTTYLAVRPQDVEARRQQARVAGWGGGVGEMRRLYGALQAAFPNDAGIAAERAAKIAFFDGRWRAAADAYARWIALEPDNGEAQFERAEALRADGQVREADAALSALESATRHRLAAAALERAAFTRGSSAAFIAGQRSADGYAGSRLIDLREQGAAFRATFGVGGRTTIAADVAHVRAAAAETVRQGARVGLTGTAAVSPRLQLDARAAVWDFSVGGVADLLVRAAWRPTDRWVLGAGANREPLFENLTTVERRIAASGVFANAAFESPRTSFSAQASAQGLSDGNARSRVTMSVSQSLGDRFRQVRLVGWAESLAYRTASPDYFAPPRHLRLDAGLEYTHAFSPQRFRGDRQRSLSLSYLVGIDNHGTSYHHPSLRLTIEFARGLAIDARAGWIRSAVYNETSAFVGIRLQTPGRSQRSEVRSQR